MLMWEPDGEVEHVEERVPAVFYHSENRAGKRACRRRKV